MGEGPMAVHNCQHLPNKLAVKVFGACFFNSMCPFDYGQDCVKKGANVNCRLDEKGFTPLMLASEGAADMPDA